MKKAWFKRSAYIHLWIYLLLKADHESGRECFFNNETIKLNRGQILTGRKKMASETGIAESTIERALKRFSGEHQIELRTDRQSRLITINNYDALQRIEQRTNNERTTGGQRADTIQVIQRNTNTLNKKENEFENKSENPSSVRVAATSQLLKFMKSLYPNAESTLKVQNYLKYNKPEDILKALKNSSCVGETGLITCLNFYKKK
jgi:DNA-binding transcriptional regulator YhcF (GntR family)